MANLPSKPQGRHAFKIAVICALTVEAEMVELAFDHDWDSTMKLGRAAGDSNTYSAGMISGHNVVLAYCFDIGSNSATKVACGLKASFPAVDMVFVVGVCGIVPLLEGQEVVLGDCVVGASAVQFDFGKAGPKGFQIKDRVGVRSSLEVQGLFKKLSTLRTKRRLHDRLAFHLKSLQKEHPEETIYPGRERDHLYRSTYVHTHRGGSKCEDCNVDLGICDQNCNTLECEDSQRIERKRLQEDASPRIHLGTFGSSNTVLKCGTQRDQLAKTHSLVAFEMEGSGVLDVYPTLIIKAGCDYADSHKNKAWQSYAAAVAASTLKAVLEVVEVVEDPMQGMKAPDRKLLNMEFKRQPVRVSTDVSLLGHLGTSYAPAVSFNTIPFPRDPDFVGRSEILEDIESKFRGRKPGYQFYLALVGMGGIGKSQIAIECAYRLLEKFPDYSIFWIYAGSGSRFALAYRDIAIAVGLEVSNEMDTLTSVHKWLSNKHNGKHVLILDNLDNRAVLQEVHYSKKLQQYLPASENVSILVTSRFQLAAADLVNPKDIMAIDVMDENLSLELLRSKLAFDEDQEENARNLIEKLERLPLAIVHAGSYISTRTPRMSISRYQKLFDAERSRSKLLQNVEILGDRRDVEANKTIMATLQMSFDVLKQNHPSAASLLGLLSLWDSQSIPDALIRCGYTTIGIWKSKDDIGGPCFDGYWDSARYFDQESEADLSLDFEEQLALLVNYSLITAKLDQHAFKLHRLVQISVMEWMKNSQNFDAQLELASFSTSTMFPYHPGRDNRTYWSRCRMLLPHALSILQHGLDWKDPNNSSLVLMQSVAKYFHLVGDVSEADRLSKAALNIIEKNGHIPPHLKGTVMGLRANALQSMGNLAEARDFALAAFKMVEDEAETSQEFAVEIQAHLGLILKELDLHEAAIEHSHQAMARSFRLFGPEHPNTIAASSNYLQVLDEERNHPDMELSWRQLFETSTRVNGQTHVTTLSIQLQFVRMLARVNKNEEAEKLAQDALMRLHLLTGPDHDFVCYALELLLPIRVRLGKLPEAETTILELFEFRIRKHGLDNPKVQLAYEAVQSVLSAQNKIDQAVIYGRQFLSRCRANLEDDNPAIDWAIDQLTIFLEQQQQFSEAEALHRERIERFKTVNHGKCFIDLGRNLFFQKRYREAQEWIGKALEDDATSWLVSRAKAAPVLRFLVELHQRLEQTVLET